jgi:PAS domain S-box-containing protein
LEKGEVYRDENGKGIRMLGIVQDITERKYAEQALRESEANYRTLVEFSPDGVLSIDSDVRITDCSGGACQLLGYSREELTGKDIRELLPNPVPEDPMPYHRQLIEDGLIETEIELMRNDGQTLPMWAKVVGVHDQKGDLSQALVYVRDITQRKKLDQLKDEFIGLVSHELRSPLTVVIGAVNTALTERERLSPEEMHQLLQDAASEAESLSHLLGNLLELSRAQADRLLLYVEPINVENIIQIVVEKIKQYHPRHRFVIDLPKKISRVPADQLRVERILYNLLENAAKYSPPDSEIRIYAKEDGEHLAIGVSDQGKGIPAQDQAKIFGPFQRLEYSARSGVKGIGLGLLVCRRLVEAHGGRIWVESKPGQGTTFLFTLPLEQKTAK